jgi:hypothetical protein
MITDIKSGDDAKEEKEMLQEQLILQAQYVDQADSVTKYYKQKVITLDNMLQDRSEMADTYKLQLDKVSRKSEQQRKWIDYLLIGFATSFIINFTH